MTHHQWLDKLVSPVSRQVLTYVEEERLLRTADRREVYPIEAGVPRLLPAVPESVAARSEVHQKLGTNFHYREHYREDAEVFDYFLAYEDGATRHEARRLHEMIAKEVPEAAETILDVGCGNAWVAAHFCPKGRTVISLDIGARNSVEAIKRYPYKKHLAVVADVYTLPFPADSMDGIIAAEIIEHVPDPRLFLEKLLEVLKPGGKLIVTTPFAEKIDYSLCVHCNRPTPQHAHLHSFDRDRLAQMVRRDQVEQLRMRTFSNKALTKLQTHVLLQRLPLKAWRWMDSLANALIKKPARLMMTLFKT